MYVKSMMYFRVVVAEGLPGIFGTVSHSAHGMSINDVFLCLTVRRSINDVFHVER